MYKLSEDEERFHYALADLCMDIQFTENEELILYMMERLCVAVGRTAGGIGGCNKERLDALINSCFGIVQAQAMETHRAHLIFDKATKKYRKSLRGDSDE